MRQTKRIRTIMHRTILLLLLLAAPVPVSAYNILPEGCLGQLTDDQVVVYYFTRKFRCQSCETLEKTILETVREYYSRPFTEGRLAMCVINVDDPSNRHYLDEFEILSNTLYIVEKKGGAVHRSRNLYEVWEIFEDAEAVRKLFTTGLGEYLAEDAHAGDSDSKEVSGPGGKISGDSGKQGPKGRVMGPGSRK